MTLATLNVHCPGMRRMVQVFCNRCYQCQAPHAGRKARWLVAPHAHVAEWSPEKLAKEPAFLLSYFDYVNTGPKIYILVCFCVGTQAVELVLASSQTSDETIRCLRVLRSRRHALKYCLSDAGPSFTGSFPDKVQAELGLVWTPNPARAPFSGGPGNAVHYQVMERFRIRVKGALLEKLKAARFKFGELEAVLADVQHVLNSRPLGG